MTTPSRPKAIRFITRDDHRLYIHPQTGEHIPGVTSVINNLPKPFLKTWGERLVAEEAVAKFETLGNLARHDEEAAVEWLKKAPTRFTGHATKVGKVSHGFMEELSLGNTVNTSKEHPDTIAIVDNFKHYLDTMQPEFLLLEEGVWDEDGNWAGTFDAIARYNCPELEVKLTGIEPVPLVGVAWQDNKTTRSGVHPEVGLQLAAYRHAKYILRPDGTVMLNKPGDFALVLHVRPEGWELIPVHARADVELVVFKHLRAIHDYVGWGGTNKQIIGQAIAGNRPRRPKRASSKEA